MQIAIVCAMWVVSLGLFATVGAIISSDENQPILVTFALSSSRSFHCACKTQNWLRIAILWLGVSAYFNCTLEVIYELVDDATWLGVSTRMILFILLMPTFVRRPTRSLRVVSINNHRTIEVQFSFACVSIKDSTVDRRDRMCAWA